MVGDNEDTHWLVVIFSGHCWVRRFDPIHYGWCGIDNLTRVPGRVSIVVYLVLDLGNQLFTVSD